ncbi:MAG: class I SAM-dependent methyltransferase [Candidatus Bathyarchaeia archaeon]|jgi:2-polyprenyl-3-methyl-5-hydroxy-6-metoxy-1,4-benzoquinol methylase
MLDEESRYWGFIMHQDLEEGVVPDLRVPFRKQKAAFIWDDTEVNLFVRGKYIKKLLNVCSSKNNAQCLELCCGTGSLSLEAARRGADVTGIDCSSGAIFIGKQYEKEISKNYSGKINLFVGDLNTIELPKKKYDSVFVWDGLHHITNIEYLVSQVSETLNDNGVFVVHDHVSAPKWQGVCAAIISELLILILPTCDNFSNKIMSFIDSAKIHKNKSQINKVILSSPFEDVSGENIISSIRNQFKIAELKRYSCLSPNVVAKIRPNCKYRFGLIRFVCGIDTFLISLRIMHPESFFLIAHKRRNNEITAL